MISEIRCERTKQFIQSFGAQTPLPWEQIVVVRDREPNFDALDMISELAQMDPASRMNVNEAFEHTFMKTYFPQVTTERVCPFKVKLDMAAVEDIDHKELVQLIESDVRCVDEPQGSKSDETQEIATSIEDEDDSNHKTSTSGASSASYYSMSSAGSQAESLDPTHSLYDADRRSPRRRHQSESESDGQITAL